MYKKEWAVAGGLLRNKNELLLVANRRRNGDVEWTPPGGVVDYGEDFLGALSREVIEETGLLVSSWSDLIYEVIVDFSESEMLLRVKVFESYNWHGDFILEDPDGIVEEAGFFEFPKCDSLLKSAPKWVQEPVSSYLKDEIPDNKIFNYLVLGNSPKSFLVKRQ